jgi:broad specificity phosphatase PhoE
MSIQRVFLIRHGETEWSLSGQHTGITDIPLTEHGRTLPRQLAPILAKVTFARIFTSPLQRARETCELAGLGERAEIDYNLVEWNYGDYEGMTPKEIHAKAPGWMLFKDWPSGRGRMSLPSRYRNDERSQLLPGRPRDQAVERPSRRRRNPDSFAVAKSIEQCRAGKVKLE